MVSMLMLFTALASAREVARPDIARVERSIVAGANEFRRANGRGALASDAKLDAAAREFARFLAGKGKLGHEADGRNPGQRIEAQGYRYCMYAENLAYQYHSAGFETAKLAALLLEGWRESPGHRANLLKKDAVHTGVGVASAPGTSHFYAVQLFGRPRAGGRC
jgi:uncharacterized protein YkwD